MGAAMNEKLSAWMDGELDGEHAHHLLSQLKCDAVLRGEWDCYHLIGDALRGIWGPDLSANLYARLNAKPTVLAPRWRNTAEILRRHALPAVAGAVAVVFVAFVSWVALYGIQQDMPSIAAIPKPDVTRAAVLAGEGAKDYLLAHQRYSPSNAMQGVAPYVRTIAEVRSPVFGMPRTILGTGVAGERCICFE